MTETSKIALSVQEAVEKGAERLTHYGHIFFPRTFRQESPDFHDKMGEALYSPARYIAMEVFRGGAKTSLLRVYASQRIAYSLSRTIMMVSVSQSHAMFSVRWLRRQVMYNKRWANTFGLTPGDKWTDEWAEIKCNLVTDENGMPVIVTLLAMGITGQIRGFNPDDFRADLILCDDVIADENSATPEQRKKIEDLLFGALFQSLAPASEAPLAKVVLLNTPMNKDDAIEKCMHDPSWHPVRFGCFDAGGKSRWETRFPTSELLQEKQDYIRRSQYRVWMREKECQIVSGEEKAIDITKLRYIELLPEYLDVVISLDPASSDSPNADEFATVAVGFKGSDVYILDFASAQKTMPDKACIDVFNLGMMYSPRKVVVEGVSYQRIMAWYLEQEMQKRRMFYPVEQLQVGRRSNADRIMQTIPGLVSFGHFYVRTSHTKLISQMDDYDPNVKNIADDILTAIANAIVSSNPGIRALMGDDLEGDYRRIEDEEDAYPDLDFQGAP